MDVVKAAHEMSEAQLRAKIFKLCVHFGLEARYVADERLNKGGWPDLTIVGTGVLWRELKSQREDPTAWQWHIGNKLTAAGQDWSVWKPSDLLRGFITEELERISLVDTSVFTADDIWALIK